MKTGSEKSSTTTPSTLHSSSQPFFGKAVEPQVQTKMTVNTPGDKFEQEADKKADQVMRMPQAEDKLQKAEPKEEKIQKKEEDKLQKAEPKEDKIQKKEEKKVQRRGDGTPSVGTGTQSAIQNKTTGGEPLSSDTKSFMEPRFGADFSNVRIHNDQESASLNNDLNARAFTYQNHIFFSDNQYQPGTSDGKQLLAHELTHTVQQGHANEMPVQRSSTATVQRAPAAAAKEVVYSSEVVDISANTFNPSAKVKEEIEAQGYKGLEVRVIIKGLTAEGRVKIRVDSKGQYDSLGKGSMALLNEWTQQMGGMYLNFTVKNNAVSGGYASLKSSGGDTNDWVEALKKNSGLLGGLGLKINNLPKPVNTFENSTLTLGVTGLKVEIGGFLDATFNLLLENTNKPKIDASSQVDVKGAAKGELKLDNLKGGLAGEVSLAVNLKSFSGAVNAKYNTDGTVDVGGKAAYNADKLSGEIQFISTDVETANKFAKDAIAAAGGKENVQEAPPPAPVPAPKPGKKQRGLAATGQLSFHLTTWFAGSVFVVVDAKGDLTVIGKIAPPAEIELFKQKDWDKELIKFEAKAYYGLPVVGNLNLFANISLHALASLGPAKIYKIEILGTYSTDPEIQKNIQILASLNISAYAGLRLRAEGGAGIEILDHDLKFGVGLNADLGIKAYAEARPTIGYRDPGEFYVSGSLEMVAQPMLGLGGDFFIELETPWWSPLSDDKWVWPLFSKEWPLGDPIGLNATVKDYVLGSGKVPEVELKKPEFDPSKFMTNMVDRTLPDKSGGQATGQGSFKEDGSVPKPVVPPKQPEPPKAMPKGGKKGAPASGGKSGKPDPKAAQQQDAAKLLKANLDALSSKAPFTKEELTKELDRIKGKVPGVSFEVQPKGDKWVVSSKAGAGKKKDTRKIELAIKGGVTSEEVKTGIAALEQVTQGYAGKGATQEEMNTAVKSVRRKFKFKSIVIEQKNGDWYYNYEINPTGSLKGPKVAGQKTPVLTTGTDWIAKLTNANDSQKAKIRVVLSRISMIENTLRKEIVTIPEFRNQVESKKSNQLDSYLDLIKGTCDSILANSGTVGREGGVNNPRHEDQINTLESNRTFGGTGEELFKLKRGAGMLEQLHIYPIMNNGQTAPWYFKPDFYDASSQTFYEIKSGNAGLTENQARGYPLARINGCRIGENGPVFIATAYLVRTKVDIRTVNVSAMSYSQIFSQSAI
jgi:hypothetical protein